MHLSSVDQMGMHWALLGLWSPTPAQPALVAVGATSLGPRAVDSLGHARASAVTPRKHRSSDRCRIPQDPERTVRSLFRWVLGTAALVACGPPGGNGAAERVADLVDANVGQVVDLRDVVTEPWTRLFIFGPYTTQAHAERMLGRPWPYRWGDIDMLDDRTFLVFLDSSRVVAAFDQLNEHGVFPGPHPSSGYARDSVRFRVYNHGTFQSGNPYRKLVWAP